MSASLIVYKDSITQHHVGWCSGVGFAFLPPTAYLVPASAFCNCSSASDFDRLRMLVNYSTSINI